MNWRLTNNHFQFCATTRNRSEWNGNAHVAVKVSRSRLKHVEWVWNVLDIRELDAIFLGVNPGIFPGIF
jgi:hypothetical protein